MTRSRMSWLMVGAAMLLFMSCHTIEELPTEPSGTTEDDEAPQQVGAITIPIILPASNPTPAPTPTPTPPLPGSPDPDPTPTPEPPPSGGGGGGSCALGGGDPNHQCARTSPTFLGDVDAALTQVIKSRPSLFNLSDDSCGGGCPRIKDHDAFTSAVERELESMGYCAFYDGEEMAVKNVNTFNDQYDISTSSGYVRRGDKSYRSTCRPAWF